MANEYKSIYSGQEVDEAVTKSQKALTTDNLVQTTGSSPNNVMSQSAVTAAIQAIKTSGTTVTVGGVSQQTWDADSKLNVSQGINNAGKAMIVGDDGNLSPQTIQTGGTSVTVNGEHQATWNADTKINVFQGEENKGKTFMVGDDGNTILQSVSGGTNLQYSSFTQSETLPNSDWWTPNTAGTDSVMIGYTTTSETGELNGLSVVGLMGPQPSMSSQQTVNTDVIYNNIILASGGKKDTIYIQAANTTSGPSTTITVTPEKAAINNNEILTTTNGLLKNQGVENSGKVLTVGSDGNVTPQEAQGGGNVVKTTTISNSAANLYSFLNNTSNTILSIKLTLKQIANISEIANLTLSPELTPSYESIQLATNSEFILNISKCSVLGSDDIYLTGKLFYNTTSTTFIDITFIVSNSNISISANGLYKDITTNALKALITTNQGSLSTFDCEIKYIG